MWVKFSPEVFVGIGENKGNRFFLLDPKDKKMFAYFGMDGPEVFIVDKGTHRITGVGGALAPEWRFERRDDDYDA